MVDYFKKNMLIILKLQSMRIKIKKYRKKTTERSMIVNSGYRYMYI